MLVLNKETIRESVWLEAWLTTMRSEITLTDHLRHYADTCLRDFDERFPEYKKVSLREIGNGEQAKEI